MKPELENFVSMRYGMFVHFGLFSMMERGEWVMNREKIPPAEMEKLAKKFNPVLKMECEGVPSIYRTGGMRVPNCRHTRYDPALSDIQY